MADALGNLARFGGHTRVHFSVAQPCILVSELVEPPLALAAPLHDAAEAYVGDVVGPLACLMPEFRAIEECILDAVAERFAVPRWQFHAPEVRRADAVGHRPRGARWHVHTLARIVAG